MHARIQLYKFFSQEWLLVTYSTLFALCILIYRPTVQTLLSTVDIQTLLSIFGFLVVVQGLQDSGFLEWLANKVAERASDVRRFAFAVVVATATLAVFVTNDLALFTFVPIVLAAPLRTDLKYRLLVLLALAANVGAFLSPIGNPQKILLWQLSGMDLLSFLKPFLLPSAALVVGLLVYVYILFPSRPIKTQERTTTLHRNAARNDAILFLLYLLLLFLRLWQIGVFLTICYFLWKYPAVFKRIDWAFLCLVLLLFMDFGLLAQHFNVFSMFPPSVFSSRKGTFFISALLAQFLSDVASAILLVHYSTHYVAIAMGATVGAFGLVVASLANMIAVRFSSERGKYIRFHMYSLPFFLFALLVVGATL